MVGALDHKNGWTCSGCGTNYSDDVSGCCRCLERDRRERAQMRQRSDDQAKRMAESCKRGRFNIWTLLKFWR